MFECFGFVRVFGVFWETFLFGSFVGGFGVWVLWCFGVGFCLGSEMLVFGLAFEEASLLKVLVFGFWMYIAVFGSFFGYLCFGLFACLVLCSFVGGLTRWM